MASWAQAAFEALYGALYGALPPIARPWLALAEHAEPTPWSGPLRHDFLLPGYKRQLAVNVFCHDDALAEAFAATVAGSAAELGVSPFPLELAARWHGGIALYGDVPRLKLYATEGLAEIAHALGIALPSHAISIGVDLTARGPERARTYSAALDPCWPAAARWRALAIAGLSHRLIATLDAPDAPDAPDDRKHLSKRSYDAIFGSEASLDDLHAIEPRLCALDPELPRCLEPAILGRLAAVAERFGLVVRPVAYEIDVFGDGRRETDALVTLAAR